MKTTGFSLVSGPLRAVAVAAAALWLAACADDPVAESAMRGDSLRFEVVGTEEWHSQPLGRAAGQAGEETACGDVVALRGDDAADRLFLHVSVAEGIGGSSEPRTRAVPVETATFYDSFGVLTYVYAGSWSETSCVPDYMYNVEVTKASSWTTSYYWPGGGRKVRFFAYAPYNGPGIVLSDETTAGTPSIVYTVPATVDRQQDLLVAASGEMAGDSSSSAPLAFAHALTAVRFATGEAVPAGRITKITLKGVYGKAVHAMGSDVWSGHAAIADFAQTLTAATDGSAGQAVTSAGATFMMLPQTLPAGAAIEIVYTDDLTKTERTLKAPIDGKVWPKGKTVTYRIVPASMLVETTFAVTQPGDWTYEGGAKSYQVRSYATVARAGDPTKSVPLPWTAEFYAYNDRTGQYDTKIARPDWLTEFTASGDGEVPSGTNYAGKSYTATVAAQTPTSGTQNDDALRKAAPVVDYDLATRGGTAPMRTANCYIVNAPGTYRLPLVYGNAIDYAKVPATGINTSAYITSGVLKTFVNHLNAPITSPYIYENVGCLPVSVDLVWQDVKELVTNVALAADRKTLTFEVPRGGIRQGNAVVAVHDALGAIMWSWHIWVTDYVPGLEPTTAAEDNRDKRVYDASGKEYVLMPVNLGWCSTSATVYRERSVKVRFAPLPNTGLTTQPAPVEIILRQSAYNATDGNSPFFQFGRKDPMPPARNTQSTEDKTCYFNGSYAYKTAAQASTVAMSIQNPLTLYGYKTAILAPWWSVTNYPNLWSGVGLPIIGGKFGTAKTIYDPSPAGYKTPESGCFDNFLTTMEAAATDLNEESVGKNGVVFWCKGTGGSVDRSAGTVYFPFSAYRSTTGITIGENANGYPYNEMYSNTDARMCSMALTPSAAASGKGYGRAPDIPAHATPIRCARE